jgi:hypothetical protein
MAKKLLTLNFNDEVTIDLAGGQTVSILLSCLDDDQKAELDIRLRCDMALNCFAAGLSPAKPTEHGPNVLIGRQVIIPLE